MKGESQDTKIDTSARMLAFTKAYDAHGKGLYVYIVRAVRNVEVAEDLNQILWGKVYESFPIEKFGEAGLLINKAKQVIANYYAYVGVRSFIEYTDLPLEVLPVLSEAKAEVLRTEQELKDYLWGDICKGLEISDTDKEIVWLKAHEGYTFEKVSEMLGIPQSTVQDRYNKARLKIYNRYNE